MLNFWYALLCHFYKGFFWHREKQVCPSWTENAEDNVKFIGEENDFGQVMTTLWVKLEALSPECKYTKAKENKISITINNNMEVKKEKHVVHQGKSTAVNRNVNPSPTESRPRPGCHNLRKREREIIFSGSVFNRIAFFKSVIPQKSLWSYYPGFQELATKIKQSKKLWQTESSFFWIFA